jgi:hypothetical protein
MYGFAFFTEIVVYYIRHDRKGTDMRYLKKMLISLAAVFCALLPAGCYTKIASFQNETMPTSASAAGSGCDDCRDEAPVSGRREICVWERDIFGWPEMRCYTTNYASSWMYFHNTPWWYRNNYGWYDTRGCPAYYYYDRVSGICRYYGGSYYPPSNSGGGGGGNAANAPSVPRRSSRAGPEESIPVQEPAASGGPMFTGSTRQLSPAPSPAPSVTAPPHNSGEGLAKPQETASKEQAPPPPQQQQPAAEQQKKNDPPPPPPASRRSSRGL